MNKEQQAAYEKAAEKYAQLQNFLPNPPSRAGKNLPRRRYPAKNTQHDAAGQAQVGRKGGGKADGQDDGGCYWDRRLVCRGRFMASRPKGCFGNS